jgi:nitrous oxide reductase accessory protein NosL
MGHELIPFASRADAEEFMNDHKGRRILKFEGVKPTVIKKLD